MADLCEFNPATGEPAIIGRTGGGRQIHEGCQNQAQVILGANGDWRVCDSCAALPHFKRYRRRQQIKQAPAPGREQAP